jgi:EAL domain-containing protein (putative c-di-GMP-specific phosphodiesterase class I)
MRDEKNNFVPPDVFIPVAEDMGMMEELGALILKEATKAATQWPNELGVAVNLSPKQFESGKLCQHIKNALEESGLDPKRLEIEITESLLMNNSQRNLEELLRIKDLGVSVAMDDFGTGYSSLSYLWKFPFDKIKIDKSFLSGMTEATDKANQIVSTIIALGHTLEMRVTAEGVETEAQAEFLNAHRCDQLQGFLLGRPMPQDKLRAYIEAMPEQEPENIVVVGR